MNFKITVKGMQRLDNDDIETARNGVNTTKDDFKHTGHTFVKHVMGDQRRHLRTLKTLISLNGISIQRLTKLEFNINMVILCHNLGALENLNQSFLTGRVSKIVHRALVSKELLNKLKAHELELTVELEDGMINKSRECLLLRDAPEVVEDHPVDELDYSMCTGDVDDSDESDIPELFQGKLNTSDNLADNYSFLFDTTAS